MKEYVERCFTACESEEDKDRTEKLLKEVLQARLQDGSAYTIDWSREPLPGSVWVTQWGCWLGAGGWGLKTQQLQRNELEH